MTYSTLDYIGGTIILGAFVVPVLLALMIQAMTFVAAVFGHAMPRESSDTYIRVKQNAYDLDEDR